MLDIFILFALTVHQLLIYTTNVKNTPTLWKLLGCLTACMDDSLTEMIGVQHKEQQLFWLLLFLCFSYDY